MEGLGAIGGLAGAGFSIAGAQEAAAASEAAARTNLIINMMNFQLRERERKDRIQQAEQNRSDTHLGARDADGNRTQFIEGVGWVTELSAQNKRIREMQQKEQSTVLGQDLPAKRAQMFANLDRQRTENFMAQGLLNEFRNIQQEDPSAWKNRLYGAATRGINEAFDAQGNQAMRKAIRTGASNTGEILASLGAAHADMLQKASQDAELKAPEMAEAQFNQRRAGAAQLYNMFAERAGRMPEVSYQPTNPSGQTNSILSQFAQEAGVSGRDLAAAFGQRGGVMDYVQPDYGQANALASTGQAVGSAGRSLGGLMGGIGRSGGSQPTGGTGYVDTRLKSGG
jgi:hypothetical protein